MVCLAESKVFKDIGETGPNAQSANAQSAKGARKRDCVLHMCSQDL